MQDVSVPVVTNVHVENMKFGEPRNNMQIVSDMTGWRTLILDYKDMGIHLFPDQTVWGYTEEWYDIQLYSFGLGPLLLICWSS